MNIIGHLLAIFLQFEFYGQACEHHWLFVCKTVFLFRLCISQFLLTRQILLTLVKCGCLFDIFRPRLSFADWFDVHCLFSDLNFSSHGLCIDFSIRVHGCTRHDGICPFTCFIFVPHAVPLLIGMTCIDFSILDFQVAFYSDNVCLWIGIFIFV